MIGDKVFLTCYSGYGLDRDHPGEQQKMMLHVICYARTNGEVVWSKSLAPQLPDQGYSQFLPEHGYASSTASSDCADSRLYVVTWLSGTFVLDADTEFKILARNMLSGDDSIFNGSPAVSGKHLFLRSNKFLYCLGKQDN